MKKGACAIILNLVLNFSEKQEKLLEHITCLSNIYDYE